MEPAAALPRLRRMLHHRLSANRRLRKADVESFPIQRLANGRLRKLVNGESQPVNGPVAQRIASLVIPPAWREVRISADPRSHIQAVGRDDAGRRQYIYHPEWEAVRGAEKAQRLRRLITALPRVRRAIQRDLDCQGDLAMLATAARLIDRLCLRAGHEEYAGEESGRGAATLLRKHVRIVHDAIELDFPGKGKRRIKAGLVDAKVARNMEIARKIKGRRLFKLRSGLGYRNMTANDLNAYLSRIAQCDISAKDFRTLRASSLAIASLSIDPAETRGAKQRAVARICREISVILFNTPSVVRKSYVHAPLLAAYEQGRLHSSAKAVRTIRGRRRAECQLLSFLEAGD